MGTAHRDMEKEERLVAFCKGAPDVLLALCSQEMVGEEPRPLTAERRAAIMADNEDLAGEGLRTLGVAFRLLPEDAVTDETVDERVEQDLVFLGLIGMIDPPSAEEKGAAAAARSAGPRLVRVIRQTR